MIEKNAFHTGRYHLAQENELKNKIKQDRHERFLKNFYERSIDLVHAQGEKHPLENENPNILQMGIASASTAKTFIDFAHSKNPEATITIADFSNYPLKNALANGLDKKPNVSLVRTDTTKLGFTDNSFNLIETDGLLQFLNPEQKIQTVKEWYRVLQPQGIVTTRDRFVSMHDHPSEWDNLNFIREMFKTKYGADTYATMTEVIQHIFTSEGFSKVIAIKPKEEPGTKLVHDIFAQKSK